MRRAFPKTRFSTKRCAHCGKHLPYEFFWTHPKEDRRAVLSAFCRPCQSYTEKTRTRHRGKRTVTNEEKRHRSASRAYTNARGGARGRGVDWNITKEDFCRIRKDPCAYCGEVFLGERTEGGLDRIDNSKGYTPDNLVSCCPTCNFTRGNRFTKEEMLEFIGPAVRAVKDSRKRKEQERISYASKSVEQGKPTTSQVPA